ncbi:MAG: 30S ribosomal protein S15 [Candidatus Jettenia sp.]|nr:30S ribosomal protein S15 [Candidatus Jettenia sp.]
MISKEVKQRLITDLKTHENDTGSPEVQVALLTERINHLSDHLKEHKKDHTLKYLSNRDNERYKRLIGRLGIRK